MPIDRKAKSYLINCPICKKDRFVTYPQWWNIKAKKCNNNCLSCIKHNIKGLEKGRGWNKGLLGFRKGHPCYNNRLTFKGRKHSPESLEKMRLAKLGIKRKPLSEEVKKKISLSNTGKIGLRGKFHWKWIFDRTKLAKHQERNDMAYKDWRKQVWMRDNFKCKILNIDCNGRIEAHHILGWSSYPELRYEVNNGITLCHAHHPLKRAEEKRLAPIFQELVSVSKV